MIGDALRNAAMRFGAALDLWHKGDLHVAEDGADEAVKPNGAALTIAAKAAIDITKTPKELFDWKVNNDAFLAEIGQSAPDVHDAIVIHWKGRLRAMKAAQAEATEEDPFAERAA